MKYDRKNCLVDIHVHTVYTKMPLNPIIFCSQTTYSEMLYSYHRLALASEVDITCDVSRFIKFMLIKCLKFLLWHSGGL